MITQERLKQLLHYDPITGIFTRVAVNNSRCKIGERAGYLDDDYYKIGIDGKYYRAHVLAWLWVNGEMPTKEIDHKNGNKLDNRLDNLRECSDTQQAQNRPVRKDSKSGYKGIKFRGEKWKGKKWQARICLNGKRISLGHFEHIEQAIAAYDWHAVRLFGEFARTNGAVYML